MATQMLVRLLSRGEDNDGCTKDTCPASESTYGYKPSLAASIIFLVIFALSGIAHAWQGYAKKTWFFGWAMVLGCVCEVLGYVAKILLWNDPFSNIGFNISVVVLTIAPAFYSAGIYFTLKILTYTFGTSLSRFRPVLYLWIFIGCDLISIILQAAGGGIAAGSDDQSTLDTGTNIMIAGLTFQVFTLVIFGLCAADYAWRVRKERRMLSPAPSQLARTMQFKLFLVALTVAYIAILIRCSYRVAELAKGWSDDNDILRNEGDFIGLDSVTCAVATVVLNVWHPGYCFMSQSRDIIYQEKMNSSGSDREGV